MKKRQSFTALELVLVITIAAILLSISIPAFYNISAGRRLTGAMTAIAANISLARATAVSSNSYVALIFNPDGDATRLAEVHRKTKSSGTGDESVDYSFERWLDDSAWEKIEEGVIIPADNGTVKNFYELNGSSKGDPVEITRVNRSEAGGGTSDTVTRAIIFTPRGQILTMNAATNPIVIRVAEGTKPPGAASYTPKKTDGKVTYGRLTVNPLTCRAEVDYVTE